MASERLLIDKRKTLRDACGVADSRVRIKRQVITEEVDFCASQEQHSLAEGPNERPNSVKVPQQSVMNDQCVGLLGHRALRAVSRSRNRESDARYLLSPLDLEAVRAVVLVPRGHQQLIKELLQRLACRICCSRIGHGSTLLVARIPTYGSRDPGALP